MKKQVYIRVVGVLLALAGIVALGIAIVPVAVQSISQADIKLMVNHDTLELEHEPLIVDGVTYVPLRECAEKLGFQVEWDNETRLIQVDTYHKRILGQSRAEIIDEQGVIPDEETALAVGKAILEGAMGRSVEYQDGERKFYLTAQYHPLDNAWRIDQIGKYEDRSWGGGNYNAPFVALNINTGEVIYIDLNPLQERMTPVGRWADGSVIFPLDVQEDGTLVLPKESDYIPLNQLFELSDYKLDYVLQGSLLSIVEHSTTTCVVEFDVDWFEDVIQKDGKYYINKRPLVELGYLK